MKPDVRYYKVIAQIKLDREFLMYRAAIISSPDQLSADCLKSADQLSDRDQRTRVMLRLLLNYAGPSQAISLREVFHSLPMDRHAAYGNVRKKMHAWLKKKAKGIAAKKLVEEPIHVTIDMQSIVILPHIIEQTWESE